MSPILRPLAGRFLLAAILIGTLALMLRGEDRLNAVVAEALEITERGSLDAVQSSEVICRVEAKIKWIVDDGAKVKKGDKLVELDDAVLVSALRKQKAVVAQAEEERKRAAESLARIKEENQIDIKVARIDVRLAELALKQYKGNDAAAKEVLELQVARASLLVDRLKVKGAAKESDADATLEAKKAAVEAKLLRQRAIEKDIADCILTAPHDGVAVRAGGGAFGNPGGGGFGQGGFRSGGGAFTPGGGGRTGRGVFTPDGGGFTPGGDPVGGAIMEGRGNYASQGQTLVVVSDLKQMAFYTLISEAVITKVRKGQKATIHIDAFPNRPFTGKVHEVAASPDASGRSVRRFKVTIWLDGANDVLKPGMTGEATIVTEEKSNCRCNSEPREPVHFLLSPNASVQGWWSGTEPSR